MKKITLIALIILALTICVTTDAYAVYDYCPTDAAIETNPYKFIGIHQIYGYVPTDPFQCGKQPGSANIGIGASGERIIPGRDVAMKGLSFGTRIFIIGIGERIVNDRGVPKGVVDVACKTNAECYATTSRRAVYVKVR
ncbi:MAG: hypothetical protein PHO15_03670 [Eubacteriales bacterium]|nr:hypothetical protein [Eubacteriales bacterium]